jgi:hypothetical protein
LEKYNFDALPYIDREFDDPAMQQRVRKAIENEMQTFAPPKRGYIGHLKNHSMAFERAPLARVSMSFVRKGESEALPPSLASDARSIIEPREETASELLACTKKLKARVQDNANTLMSLNLHADANLSGPIWRDHNETWMKAAALLEADAIAKANEVQAKNKKRTTTQRKQGEKLAALKRRRLETSLRTRQAFQALN